MDVKMDADYTARLKTRLLCEGMRIDEKTGVDSGRTSGAGPFGQYIIVADGTFINAPTYATDASSFLLTTDERAKKLCLQARGDDRDIAIPVTVPQSPRYYDFKTSDGIQMSKIALRHGTEVFASTIYQNCVFAAEGRGCKFCAIKSSLESKKTTLLKTKQQIKEAAAKAWELGEATHTTFTTGTLRNEEKMIAYLNEACDGVKEVSEMQTHVQITPPKKLELIDSLRADTIGIHIESFDEEVLGKICPAKYDIGFERYFAAIERAVKHVGEHQVSSFILLGLGEDTKKTIAGCERLCECGAIPYLVPFRPLPQTALEKTAHPDSANIIDVCERVAVLMKKYGIRPEKNKAGCVRCGGCSPIKEFCKR